MKKEERPCDSRAARETGKEAHWIWRISSGKGEQGEADGGAGTRMTGPRREEDGKPKSTNKIVAI